MPVSSVSILRYSEVPILCHFYARISEQLRESYAVWEALGRLCEKLMSNIPSLTISMV